MGRSFDRDLHRKSQLAGLAVLAPRGEEVGPGDNLGVLLDQRASLAFGQAAPNTKLHMVVERVGEALGDDGTTPTNNRRSPLRRSSNKEVVGIVGATPRFRYPLDAGFGLRLAAGVNGEWIHVGCYCPAVEYSGVRWATLASTIPARFGGVCPPGSRFAG